MAYQPSLVLGDGPQLDAFDRLRVSEPYTVFDSKMIADNQPLSFDDQQTAGTATSTYNTNQSSVTLAVTSGATGTRVRQTFRRFNYQPGKSQMIFITGIMGATVADAVKRIGLFDAQNGYFFENDGTDVGVVRRTYTSGSAVDNRVAQSAWNIDPMDGTGRSGINLDFTKVQIFFMDFEWLGVGRIRLGFVINGIIYYCHQFLIANVISLVSATNPNLPVRYELSSTSAVDADLTAICSAVISEGGKDPTGNLFSVDRGSTGLTTLNDADIYPLIAIRLKSAYQFADVQPNFLSIICTSTAAYRFALLLNPTITGTALSFTALTNSAIEFDVSRTNGSKVTAGTGTQIASGYEQNNNQGGVSTPIQSNIRLGANIAGTSDILVLAVQRITGTTETFYGALGWRELQ
jgi:hypothetical protein